MEKIQIIAEGFWLISQNFWHLPLITLGVLVVGAIKE
jgi:hypothetical protein